MGHPVFHNNFVVCGSISTELDPVPGHEVGLVVGAAGGEVVDAVVVLPHLEEAEGGAVHTAPVERLHPLHYLEGNEDVLVVSRVQRIGACLVTAYF